MLRTISAFVSARLPLLGAVAALAIGRSCSTVTPPLSTEEGLAAALSDAARVAVDPQEVGWEPSRGLVTDVVFGRRVLFLGQAKGQPRDLYRATFRVTPEGKLVRPTRVVKLTDTPLADERGLTVTDSYAALAGVAFGRVATVSLLDLAGIGSAFDSGIQRGVTAFRLWAEQGSAQGLGLTHFAVDQGRVELGLEADSLRITDGSGHVVQANLAAGTLSDPGGVVQAAWRQPPAPRTFAETWQRWVPSGALANFPTRRQVTPVLPDGVESDASHQWPPAAIAPFVAGQAQDGRWQPVDGTDELVFQTELAIDPADDDSRLQLVTFDLRRLELRMAGGYAWPKPASGPPGTGRVPDRLEKRLVATFNGVGESNASGMKVDQRVQTPAQPGLPSVVLTEQGQVGLGSWPDETPSEGIVSFRQANHALVVDGRATVSDAVGTMDHRSALCLLRGGGMAYARTPSASRAALAQGLARSGCRYAIELATRHTGFATISGEGQQRRGATVVGGSDFAADVHLLGSPSDFFYLVERTARPSGDEMGWTLSPGVQPEPSDVPALLSARERVGNLEVEVFSVDLPRVVWRVLGGNLEPLFEGKAAPPRELSSDEQGRVLFAFDVGHTTRATRYGLAFGERETLSLRSTYATAVFGDSGVELLAAGNVPQRYDDAQYVQLPELLRDGQLTKRASQPGARRQRGAICVRPDGRLLAAFVTHDSSAPLALQLLAADCDSALELDRASQHSAVLYRAGTSLDIPRSSDTTLIVGLAEPMPQSAFLFGSEVAAE